MTAGELSAPGRCQVSAGGAWCGEPADSTWEGGCVHEHVTADIGICAGHRRIMEAELVCVKCLPDHACLVRLREVARA